MKKTLLLIPLIILSCNTKQETVTEDTGDYETAAPGTMKPSSSIAEEKLPDSVINSLPKVQEVLREGVMREEKANQIIRTVDAANLPFTIGDEFTREGQECVIKIQNFNNKAISASIVPQSGDMNIRVNQIKLADGKLDGPLGREIVSYPVHVPGEIWLTVGKSNMASGKTTGAFSVKIQ